MEQKVHEGTRPSGHPPCPWARSCLTHGAGGWRRPGLGAQACTPNLRGKARARTHTPSDRNSPILCLHGVDCFEEYRPVILWIFPSVWIYPVFPQDHIQGYASLARMLPKWCTSSGSHIWRPIISVSLMGDVILIVESKCTWFLHCILPIFPMYLMCMEL